MAAKPKKLKAKNVVKKSIKKAAKKAAKKAVKKAAKKTAPKAAVKVAPKKAAAGANATSPRAGGGASPKKPAPAKKVVKKVAKKVAKKAVKKTAAKSPAVKKVVIKKAAKKAAARVVKKSAAGATHASPKKAASAKKVAPVVATVAAPVATPVAAPKPAPAPAMPHISLKGLKGISGAKAARIAQIVAESFLPKATEPPAETKVETAAPATLAPHDVVTDTLVSSPQASGEALTAAHKAAAVLFSKKADDVVLMDLRNLSTLADYYLIATCTNEPQMRSMLGTVQRSLSREGIKSLRSEYMSGARWAVIDYGDLIVHLFEKQTRGYYSLERLWADAPATTLKAEDYALPDEADADEDGDL